MDKKVQVKVSLTKRDSMTYTSSVLESWVEDHKRVKLAEVGSEPKKAIVGGDSGSTLAKVGRRTFTPNKGAGAVDISELQKIAEGSAKVAPEPAKPDLAPRVEDQGLNGYAQKAVEFYEKIEALPPDIAALILDLVPILPAMHDKRAFKLTVNTWLAQAQQ